MFIEIIKTIILGIVEGITEWLPISSTGHMILVEEFLNFDASPAFVEMFRVVIQLGAIMAVVVLFFHKLNPFAPSKTKQERNETIVLWFKVAIATIPAAVIGLLFDDWLDAHLYNYITVALMLIIYGVLFILVENMHKDKSPKITTLKEISYRTAFLIGMFQVLSLIPGTSRSGATILGAIYLGTSRFIAAEFSFFMSIPAMFGASFLKLIDFGFVFTSDEIIILITGMITAFIVSILAIKFLIGYIKNHDFKVFGYYRIILGVIVVVYFLIQSLLV